MKVTFVAATLTLSLYERSANAWALVDSIVLSAAVFGDGMTYFLVQADCTNASGAAAAIVFDYLEVKLLNARDM